MRLQESGVWKVFVWFEDMNAAILSDRLHLSYPCHCRVTSVTFPHVVEHETLEEILGALQPTLGAGEL